MADKTEIYNIAVGRVGEGFRIQDPAENTAASRDCNRFWDNVRRTTLRAFDWPFAKRIKTGALLSQEPQGKWLYFYSYPSDALKVRAVISCDGNEAYPKQFEIMGFVDDAGNDYKVIGTDEPDALIVYTRDLEDVSFYDALCVDAMAWRMASEIAPARSESRVSRIDAINFWQAAIAEARSTSVDEAHAYEPEPESMLARL